MYDVAKRQVDAIAAERRHPVRGVSERGEAFPFRPAAADRERMDRSDGENVAALD